MRPSVERFYAGPFHFRDSVIKRIKAALARRCNAIRQINGPVDALAHVRIALIAVVFTTFLRLRLSQLLLKWLKSVPQGKQAPSPDRLEKIVRRTDNLLLLGQPVIRSECLARSCLLYYQMRRAGANVDIRFGVAMQGKNFRSHCWVLVDGEPTYELFDPRVDYKPLFNLHDQGIKP